MEMRKKAKLKPNISYLSKRKVDKHYEINWKPLNTEQETWRNEKRWFDIIDVVFEEKFKIHLRQSITTPDRGVNQGGPRDHLVVWERE